MTKWTGLALLAALALAAAAGCNDDSKLTVASICAEMCDAQQQCAVDGGFQPLSYSGDCRADCEGDYAEDECQKEWRAYAHCYFGKALDNGCVWTEAEQSCAVEVEQYYVCKGWTPGSDA
jgi:hypothetical protein